MCAGTEIEAPFSASCSADDEANAASLLDAIASNGCDGVGEGKADGVFCGAWDPFGWCEPPASPSGPEPQGDVAQYPILLAHGFNTSTTNFWRFNDVDLALIEDGHDAFLGSVPPFDTPSVRATYLSDQIDEILASTGAEKVNLVCFSQGGLDCRYLVSPGGLNRGDVVASVSLISAPNRGTYVADLASAVLPDPESASARLVDVLTSWYGGTFSELAQDSRFVAAMESMSEATMVGFNESIVDHPEVYYQSWAGFSYVAGLPNPRDRIDELCVDAEGRRLVLETEDTRRDVMDPLLVASAAMVAHGTELRPNDGVATVESAIWGNFRGCIPADHLDQVGQIRDEGPDRRTGFDYLRFYRNIAFDLAALGF